MYYCREFIGKISIKSAAEEEELKKRKGKARLPPAINQLISIGVLYPARREEIEFHNQISESKLLAN